MARPWQGFHIEAEPDPFYATIPLGNDPDSIISMQCVNYRDCGGNAMVRTGTRSRHSDRSEIVVHTCPCLYSDGDLAWFHNEIVSGRAHP
jgi:hypothetical protein